MTTAVDDDVLLVPRVLLLASLLSEAAVSELGAAPPAVKLSLVALLLWALELGMLDSVVLVVPVLAGLRAGWIAAGDVTANPAILSEACLC